MFEYELYSFLIEITRLSYFIDGSASNKPLSELEGSGPKRTSFCFRFWSFLLFIQDLRIAFFRRRGGGGDIGCLMAIVEIVFLLAIVIDLLISSQ